MRAGMQTIQVPYAPGKWAIVQAAFPLIGGQWKQLGNVLEAMKPGLVEDEPKPETGLPSPSRPLRDLRALLGC
jgi:hypothetical protein